MGLSVGTLKTVDREIFEICGSPQWVRLARGYLLVRPTDGSAKFLDTLTDADVKQASILLQLDRIFVASWALLEVGSEEAQHCIAFPPLGLSDRRTAESART